MLHEEVELKYDELQSIVQDFNLLEQIRAFIPVGVSIIEFEYIESYERIKRNNSLLSFFRLL